MMTNSAGEGPRSRSDQLEDYVASRAGHLAALYLVDQSAAVASLARLRRGLGTRQPLAEVWDVFVDMPESLMGRGDEPARTELAAAHALQLFALHQQARRDASMHVRGWRNSLGRGVGRLAGAARGPGVERRFRALTRSNDLEAAAQHLRGLVTQLRGERIALDYGLLARDLYQLQQLGGAHRVHMLWTRDFHRPLSANVPAGDVTTGDLA